jgi:transposase
MTVEDLPQDLDLCHQLILKLAADNEHLGRRLQELLRSKYGRKSETINPDQLNLFAKEILAEFQQSTQEVISPVNKIATAKKQKQGGGGRNTNRTNLPVETKEYKLPETELPCPECKQPRTEIGYESAQELEFIPASFKIIKHVQTKYACKNCQEQVVLAPRTDVQPIEKGMPGFGLLAQIITSKYVDHLPLYRQEQIYWRLGADIARSSMCRWLSVCAEKLNPLANLMKEKILQSRIINADETPVKFLKPGAGKAPLGYVWTYIGDKEHPYVIFDFHPNRKAEHPEQFLAGFTGYLQTDAYSGYNGLHKAGQVKPVACFAHARRYFEKALNNDKVQSEIALAQIAVLYQIEKMATDVNDDERVSIRVRESIPRLREFNEWLKVTQCKVLPKSSIGEAIAYSLTNWDKLHRYTEQGFISIDNNLAENSLRPIALGRKNWMFIGSEDSGEIFSILASLAASCKRLAVEPYAYFYDVIKRITARDYSELEELLPDHWSKNYAQISA